MAGRDDDTSPTMPFVILGGVFESTGLGVLKASEHEVQFGSDRVLIDVAHHDRNGDITVECWRPDDPKRISFLLFLRSIDPRHPAAVVLGSCTRDAEKTSPTSDSSPTRSVDTDKEFSRRRGNVPSRCDASVVAVRTASARGI